MPRRLATCSLNGTRATSDSYLIEITAEILHHKDAETGKPFVDVVVDHAGMKGTGTWTVQTGLECGSPVAAIGEAVFARALSSHGELREDAQKEGLAGPNKTIDLAGEDKAAFVEDVRKALFASKVVAYAQGLNEIQDGAKEYGWDINLSEVARIWRGGCIIRAQFLLDRITEAFRGDNPPASLLFDPYFEKIDRRIAGCMASRDRSRGGGRHPDPGVLRLPGVLRWSALQAPAYRSDPVPA